MKRNAGRRSVSRTVAAGVLLAALVQAWPPGLLGGSKAAAAPPPVSNPGFVIEVLLTGLTEPVAARFAPDGRILVAERAGLIKLFDGPRDRTPVIVADLRGVAHDFWDRGLLGLALDPEWSTQPYVYALYTYDRDPFDPASPVPRWGSAVPGDDCPAVPGPGSDGCIVTARISRFLIRPDGSGGPEQVVMENDAAAGFCFQSPSHNVDHLDFGPDGRLYSTVGDGASFGGPDYGQNGGKKPSTQDPITPANPCNDAPHYRGTPNLPTTGEGGALRAQGVRSTSTDGYTPLNGALLRMDKNTGQAPADNPLVGNGVPGDDRVVAYGLRNPFRFSFRPGTNEVWIGDVGWNDYEEINRAKVGPGQPVANFGWPCYEGPARLAPFDALNNGLCESLYADVDASRASNVGTKAGISPYVPPVIPMPHDASLGGCRVGNAAVIAGVFTSAAGWPAELANSYVFGDYGAACIYAMPLNPAGDPDFSRLTTLVTGTGVVDVARTPDGSAMWSDFGSGEVYALRPAGTNVAPTAVITASTMAGPAPLSVTFSAEQSTDGNVGDPMTFEWDLDNDGQFDDATGFKVDQVFPTLGVVVVGLRATDSGGLSDSTTITIAVSEIPPVVRKLETSLGSQRWIVGQPITMTVDAYDDAPFPADNYRWTVTGHHCPPGSKICHAHTNVVGALPNAAQVVLIPPDHELDFYLEVTVTVTDAVGLTGSKTIELKPKPSGVTAKAEPGSLTISAGDSTATRSTSFNALAGASVTLSAPSPQENNGRFFAFTGWLDDAGAQAQRKVTVPETPGLFVARFGELRAQIDAGGLGGTGGFGPDVAAGGANDQVTAPLEVSLPGVSADVARTVRRGNAQWSLRLAPGRYRVVMLFTEPSAATAAGGRVFDVSAEGAVVLPRVDVVATAGKAGTTIAQSFDVPLTDEALNISVTGRVGEPVVSGIQVIHLSDRPDGFDRITAPANSGYATAVREK